MDRSVPCAFALAAWLVGCGSSPSPSSSTSQEADSVDPSDSTAALPSRPPGSGEIVGTLGGESMIVADAVASFGAIAERDEARRGVRIVLHDRPGTCAAPGVVHPGEQTLTLEIDGERDLGPGTYGLPEPFAEGPGLTMRARLDRMGNTCQNTGVVALDGTVTLLEVDAARDGSGYAKGTFELKLGRDRVTGSFVATGCAGAALDARDARDASATRCAR